MIKQLGATGTPKLSSVVHGTKKRSSAIRTGAINRKENQTWIRLNESEGLRELHSFSNKAHIKTSDAKFLMNNMGRDVRRTFFDISDDDIKKKPAAAQPASIPKKQEPVVAKQEQPEQKNPATGASQPPKPTYVYPTEPLSGQCLNYLAQQKLLEPIYEREYEINLLNDIISRTKGYANAILVGKPGVGRRSIVNGLAQKLSHDDVASDRLKTLKIYEIYEESLQGGSVQQQFMKTLEKMGICSLHVYPVPPHPNATIEPKEKMSFLFGSKPPKNMKQHEINDMFNDKLDMIKLYNEENEKSPAVLYIPNLFQLVDDFSFGFYSSISNVIKPLMEKKKIIIVGCMTEGEYAKFSNGSLRDLFQPIHVKELEFAKILKILEKKKELIECAHGVTIPSPIVEEALRLTDRYIKNHAQPLKSLTSLSDLATRVERSIFSTPQEILDLEASIMRMMTVDSAKEGTKKFQSSLNKLSTQHKSLKDEWLTELNNHKSYIHERKTLSNLKLQLAECVKYMSVEPKKAHLANDIITNQIPALKERISKYESKSSTNKYVKYTASMEDLAVVVSRNAQMNPKDILLTNKSVNSLINLEDRLGEHIIGQSEAIQSISRIARICRAGLRDEKKPQGMFMFVARSGVGKTELARQLAKHLYGSEDSITKIDMSEYTDQWSLSRLIGTGPGYIGYGDGGQLTNSLKKNPHQVVLFDEIEKGCADVRNILLQIMDDGICTDGFGQAISFRNATIIITSNVGTMRLQQEREEDKGLTKNEIILDQIKQTFPPEFINRFDEVIVFNDLDIDHLDKILSLQVKLLEERLSSKKRIDVSLTKEARQYLLYQSFDIQHGARPIKRNLEKLVIAPITELFFKGQLEKHCTVHVDFKEKNLSFSVTVNQQREDEEAQQKNIAEIDELLQMEYHVKRATQQQQQELSATNNQ